MGVGFARAQLVYRINDAFGPDKIAATADSVATLPPEADTFDILHSLGLFQFPPGLELDAYRRSLPIPELNKQAMTAAFQASVKGRIPLSFAIVSGEFGADPAHLLPDPHHRRPDPQRLAARHRSHRRRRRSPSSARPQGQIVSATGPRRSPQIETEPELRRVTVLFADIQGSTALIQNLDPEQAAQLIDPALRTMIDAVERFDGIASHRGDGIMAIFGAPSASEDHGVRACLAALSIRDALAANPQLRARIGIHVGDVVFRPVRVGRSWSQDAVGIAVHIAARLEQTAEPGTICLSGDVWRFARGFVNAMPLEAVAVRGLDRPIERYLLLDADRTANRWGVRAANGLASFVNRIRELATLTRVLTESGAARPGRVAHRADPGTGRAGQIPAVASIPRHAGGAGLPGDHA